MDLKYPLDALIGLAPIRINTETIPASGMEVDLGCMTVKIRVVRPQFRVRVICTELVFKPEQFSSLTLSRLPLEACFSRGGQRYAARVFRDACANYRTAPSSNWMLSFRPAIS
jgi:hypothetical protein